MRRYIKHIMLCNMIENFDGPDEACLGGRIGAVRSVTCLKVSAGVRGIQMYVHVVQELESRISQRSHMYLYPTMSSTASH